MVDQFKIYTDQSEIFSYEEKMKLYDLLIDFYEVFLDEPGVCNVYEYKLKLKDDSNSGNLKIPYYPIPVKHLAEARRQIVRLLEEQIIATPYVSPLCVSMKTDGSIRLCYDGRYINKLLVPDYTQVESSGNSIRKDEREKM